MAIHWKTYNARGAYDTLLSAPGEPRPVASALCAYLASLSGADLRERRAAAELAIRNLGITFTVYSEEGGSIDRAWPFDIIPRVIARSEWERIERGLRQRVHALNLFIDDIYHQQRIVRAGEFPGELLADSKNFRPQCVGVKPPHRVWA